MKIKNDSVRIQIGNKKYDFHNLILNEYIKRLINKQLSKESATNLTLTESTILTYLLLKLDTPINNLTQDSSITNYNFDIAIVHGASKHQNISEKQVVMQYDYNILINDYVIDLNLVQQGKKSPETIKYLSDFYDRKITAIGFTTHWYPYKEVPVCAVLDTSNYSIFLERNQDLTISRKDIITTDAEFSTNNKEKVKGPAHLSPLGLPQIIYQPSIVQILKDDEGNDYIKKHEFYDYAKGVLTSVGLSQNPNYIEKEYKIGEDIQAVNNETEIEINGIINDEKEEGNVYPSDELFPIEPRTLPIQSSKGIKETSIKTNEENDFFVNIDGKSTQDGTPTPSNPVEIKSIGDEGTLNIKQRGKNRLINSSFRENWTNWRISNNGTIPIEITEKLGQKCLHITGELQKVKAVVQNIQERVEKGKTYTLSCMAYLKDYVSGTTNPFISFYTDGKTTGGAWTSGCQVLSGHINFLPSFNDYSKGFVKVAATLKVLDDTDLTKTLGLYVYARDFTGDLYVYDIQLEEDLEEGTEATDYEEYFNNTYTLPLSEPLRSLRNGTKDTIEEDGTHRRVRHLSLAVSDMNGSENYPGWSNLSQLKEDLGSNYNTPVFPVSLRCNILKDNSYLGLNTKASGSLFLNKDVFNLTQTEWKEQYPNLVVEIDYELSEEVVEPFTEEQLEIINSMVTEKGTNIFNINEDTGTEAVEYEGLYPETVNYKYVVFKYTVYQLVVTGVDSEGIEVQEIKDTGCYYYQAIPLEKFKKMKIKIKYERG